MTAWEALTCPEYMRGRAVDVAEAEQAPEGLRRSRCGWEKTGAADCRAPGRARWVRRERVEEGSSPGWEG